MEKYKGRCKQMAINPYFKGDMKEEYPVIQSVLSEFKIAQKVSDAYIKYCSLVLDPTSPMVQDFPDSKTRRQHAAAEVGFKGELIRLFEIGLLMRVYRVREWTLLNSIEFTYDEYTQRVNEPIDIEDKNEQIKTVEIKNKLIDQMWSFIDKMNKLKIQIFGSDEELAEEFNAMTPEKMAKMLNKKN